MRDHSREPGRGYKAVACGVLLALSLSWGTAGAAAKETARGTGNPYIGKVTQLRDKFKYDDALQMIEQARKWPSNTQDEKVTLDLLEGVLRYEAMHQPELAEQSFVKALTARPDAQLPLEVSPKITDLLEAVRARVKKPVILPPHVVESESSGTERTGPETGRMTETPKTGGRERLLPYRTPLAIAGGGLVAVGVFTWVQAKSTEQRLRAGDASITTRTQFDGAVRRGKTFETVGWFLAGVGAATTLGSLLLLRPPSAVPSAGAVPTQGGAYVSLVWRTP